jgi:hypothetical protein
MNENTERTFPVTVHAASRRTSLALIAAALILAACGGGGRPTRTPVPTWTPTAAGAAQPQQVAATPVPAQPAAATPLPAEPVVEQVPVPPTDTPAPPTPEPPTATPVLPTDTPAPTPTPSETPTPQPTPTPSYAFELEAAEKLPTESLAPNVVRIWVYAYSPSDFGLPGYTVRVTHNGSALTVEETTTEGLPGQTRTTPGPFTKFTNMNVIFVQPQEGSWEVQLLDVEGAPAGAPALFELSADEITRELYVRYKLR